MNVRIRFFNIVATAVAIGVGVVTLAGYFVPLGLLGDVRLWLVALVSVLAAWAVLAGALNLLLVHTQKFLRQAPGGGYSALVVVGFALVVAANLIGPFLGGGRGAGSAANTWFLTHVISAGGAALAALIAFFLVYAGYRLLRQKITPMRLAFVVTVIVALVALAPWPVLLPNVDLGFATLRDLLREVTNVPALGGVRGLLLGIALGAVATGLRLLLGLDRPYGD